MPSARSAQSVADDFGVALPDHVPGFVDGEACRHEAASHGFDHLCPATEESLYRVIECDAAVVDRVVTAAQKAFDSGVWSRLSVAARKPVLRRMIDAIDRHRDELAAIQSLEVGLPLSGVQGMHMQR